jgi:heme exporter protein D
MSFSNWQEFLHMGGYALYVWISYGLTLAILGGVLVAPMLRHRRLRRDLDRRERREQREKKR